MNDIFAIVFPVVSVLATLLCTILADAFREKRIFRYRLHSEVFLMKIKLYEELLRITGKVPVDSAFKSGGSKQLFNDFVDTVADILFRIELLADEKTIKVSKAFIGALIDLIAKDSNDKGIGEAQVKRVYDLRDEVKDAIREELQSDIYKKPKKGFFSKLDNRRPYKNHKDNTSNNVN